MTFRIEVFRGTETAPYIRALADMRLETFYEFPYLYVGKLEDELAYTQLYTLTPHGILVIAFEGETIVGLYSGLPLDTPGSMMKVWSDKLKEEGIILENCFYAGELIVKPAFQNKGIGSQLMKRLLREVDERGFREIMGVTAIRPLNHPLRPQKYFDTDTIWGKYGLVKSSIILTGAWLTRQSDGTAKVEDNQLACWLRKKPS
ncbi:MAG: GNAT family N-acetyltransferase [Alphaproteobacteria bacterium]|nr:GNAT family N-acetyltransferase [Alphaproteobacteria bacterium]